MTCDKAFGPAAALWNPRCLTSWEGPDLQQEGDDIAFEEAVGRAEEIYRWHQETFRDYWAFLRDSVRTGQRQHYCHAMDGWMYFCDRKTAFTQLLNFPIQSNAAAMLREAVKLLAPTDLEVTTTLHDTVYVYCPEEEAERYERELIRCMDEACRRTIGDEFVIRVETKVYDNNEGYRDERGAATHGFVRDFLDCEGL